MLLLENMEVWRAVRCEFNSRNGKTAIFTDFFRVRSISYSTIFPLPYEYDYSQKVKYGNLIFAHTLQMLVMIIPMNIRQY